MDYDFDDDELFYVFDHEEDEGVPNLSGLLQLLDQDVLFPAMLKQPLRDRPEDPIRKYFLKHPSDKELHANYEKELQAIVLEASENGYIGTLRRAIPVIRKVEERLYEKVARPGLNFSIGRRPDGTKQFYTPLVYACEGGSREIVELLLDEGAKLDYVGSERIEGRNGHKRVRGSRLSAFHVACIRGREDIVTLLLTRPKTNLLKKSLKDVLNARTKDQWTPLMYAVKEGHVQVVKVLLEQESLEALVGNKKGQTALHIAGLHSRLDCLRELHASLSLRESSREKLALVDDNPYMQADKKGYNVLHRICKGPRVTGGTNISVEALQWVFETMPHLDKPEILNQGTREEGYSMLLLACDNGNRDLVEYLLAIKAVDVGFTTKDGKTGLHLAALHDYPEIAELLLSHDISITVQDSERKDKDSDKMIGEDTALHIAVRKSSFDVEKKIRSLGGITEVLKIQNKLGETPDIVKSDETIPLEIRRLGEDAIQRYKQLLRKGKQKKMPRCNLIALGEQGVGKTSLLSLLMGEKFLEKRDSTRGIDHDDISAALVELLNVSSEEWTRVKPDVIAKKNQEQFISSVAEELKPHFHGKKESAGAKKRPQPDELEADIFKIVQYLDEVEQKAKMLQEDPPKLSSSQQPQAMKGATVSKRSETSSQKLVRNVDKPTVPSENKKPAVKKPKAEQPKVIPLPFSPSQPPVPPSSTQIETLPATGEGGGAGNSPRVRDANFGRRLSKSIVASAKEKSNVVEPVLQYKALDFAGQPEYRAMHHCFIVRRAIYLMVFNLQSVMKAVKAPDEKNKRALEEIWYWLNSIHAHIHMLGPEPDTLKRILLVGTHRGEMVEGDMKIIDKELKQYMKDTPLYNDMYRAGGEVWFAAVENSIDGEEERDRQESGGSSLQVSIRDAWNDLPFKKEEYPSTWLLFEDYLHQQRGMAHPIVSVASIKSIARREYGIGEDSDKDAELALGFFHDTGTIIYPKKHPSLYLTGEQKKKLDSLVLLDPSWLTMMMRNVMELQTGKGGELANNEIEYLEDTGCAELSLLRKGCWSKLSDDDLDNLILMLQSFCIIFPLPPNEVPAPIGSGSTPISSTEEEADSDALQQSQREGQASSTLDIVYLIPSKLCTDGTQPFGNYKFSFVIDFCGFLPEQVYHRLLCLMLKKQLEGENDDLKSKGEFKAHYFKIKGVEKCNWMVHKVESKLRVSVLYPESNTFPPVTYVDTIDREFLLKICNEEGSSLQGLKYEGGPEHMCTSGPVVVPYVTFPPKDAPLPYSWKCEDCLRLYKDMNVLLDPEYKKDSGSSNSSKSEEAAVACTNNELQSREFPNITIEHVEQVVLTGQNSNVFAGGTHSCTGLCEQLPSQTCMPASVADTSSQSLGIDDLQEVLEALVGVSDWKRLGLALGLKHSTLENVNGMKDEKYEMLSKWLHRVDNSSPSWDSLAKALRKKTVGLDSIADEIEREVKN